METAGYAALSRQTSLMREMQVIANNIANANTTGFKSGRAAFQDLMYQSVEREGALTAGDGTSRPVGLDVGLGAQVSGVIRLNSQGGLLSTENQLDLAIEGRGHFILNRPDGTQVYTRDGSFQLSDQGELVTQRKVAARQQPFAVAQRTQPVIGEGFPAAHAAFLAASPATVAWPWVSRAITRASTRSDTQVRNR